MNYISNHNNYIELILLIFVLLVTSYQFLIFTKTKKRETKRLSVLIGELEKEKKLSESYKSTSEKIAHLERSTQQKLRIIKVDIANVDFTFKEVFYCL